MAEVLVSGVLGELAKILVEQVKADVKLVVGVDEEVQKLTSNFTAIKAVLEDAENRQVKDNAVRDWLDKLNDISYDIQDVLDEWNTAVWKLHMKKIENASKFMKKVRSIIPAYRFTPKKIVLRRDITTKVRNLNKKLDNIAMEKDTFGFSLRESTRELERKITTSVVDLSKVHGRVKDKNAIVDLLLRENSHGVASLSITSIVGMGGLGKTTLARLVYHDDRVNTHFDEKIWVCVSDPFDEIRIARAILESLQGVASNLVEYETLLHNIGQIVDSKKFLVVLDDVWTEDAHKWEQLRDSLQHGSQKSRILLTTRKENVAKIMGTTNIIPLGKLPEEECWSLFSQVGFFERSIEECKKLEGIGHRIVSKCNGLPLAVKTLGSMLSLKTRIEQWQSVLDSDMWKLEEIEKGLFPPLLLSYYDLPCNLRKCFSYCAIFPKDYKINKDKLIKLWMAQGYLRIKEREDMELVGEDYFENLSKRSFFQDFETNGEDGGIISCKMHDIVHDFAQYLTKNECLTVEVDDPSVSDQLKFVSQKVQHSMIILKTNGSFPLFLSNAARLRSLMIECHKDFLTSDILSKLFDKLTCLRAIDFESFFPSHIFQSIKIVPREIGKLTYLRYLSLKEFTDVKELPEELCGLYNLQTLDISSCVSLKKLPEGLGKLVNLRHFVNTGTNSLSYLPKGMERLTSLRTLSKFLVSGNSHGSKACTLACLKNFKYLQGYLEIRGLGNVTDIAEVKNTDLKSKRSLLHFILSFYKEEKEGRQNVLEDKIVLEGLQPPPNLENLEISHYESKTMAIHQMGALTTLKIVTLRFCKNLERLPPLGSLPSLESLSIFYMQSLREVGSEFLAQRDETSLSSPATAFPKLKSLEFNNIDMLEEWDYRFLVGEDFIIMPCIRSLKVYDCPKLVALPDHILQSTTLEELVFDDSTKLEARYSKEEGEDWDKISHIPKVRIVSS